jgi:branched-chain amino acid transport system ATP-binding protein
MNHCQRIVVLNMGTKIAEGVPHEIRQNETVLAAYFGT